MAVIDRPGHRRRLLRPPDPQGNEEPSIAAADNPRADAISPGSDIASALRESDDASDLWSRTGMATPWVAGAAALLRELDPEWTPAQLKDRL